MSRSLLALTLIAGLSASACATASAPSTGVVSSSEAESLARNALSSLRAAQARVRGRIDAIRDTVRARDPLAAWRELVCLEGRLPSIETFANRGERAYQGFRLAMIEGRVERAEVRLASLDIARRGVEKQFAEARACGSPEGDVSARVPAPAAPSGIVSLSVGPTNSPPRSETVVDRVLLDSPSTVPAVAMPEWPQRRDL